MPDDERDILAYATPNVQNVRRWPVSRALGLSTVLCGSAIALCIPSMVGSGRQIQNPVTAISGCVIWAATILYVWLRVRDEDGPRWPSVWIATCGTIAILAAPVQLRVFINDPGYPQSAFRRELLGSGAIACAAILGFVIGRRFMPAQRRDVSVRQV